MYKPHTSGVTNHIALYKQRFEELGHEVCVFTFGDRDHVDDEQCVYRSPGIPWGDTGWNFAIDHSREVKAVAATMDIAHVHHPFQSGRIALRMAAEHRIPVVFTNHTRYDLYSDAYAGYVPRPLRYAFLQRTLREAYEQAALVIAPSAGIAEWLSDLDVCDNIEVIPNGVDTRPFAHPSAPVSRAALGLSEEDVVVCYCGRVAPEKNSLLLAESFALAAEASPSLRLLVVGDGPSREVAEDFLDEAGLSDRVRFVGMQPYHRIPDFEAAADVFCTASVSEVHPLVVLEAMAAGLPVIGVVSPGVADTVADELTGLLAPVDDAEQIASRIVRLAEDADLRRRLSEAASAEAERYDLPHTADLVLERYSALAKRKRA
jgi:glycosyltransferase involved in cell wall biosynthesis